MEINRSSVTSWLKDLQDEICHALEKADGRSKFSEENWTRPEGGGGSTRIIQDGNVIEKGGVLFSAVEGIAPDFLFSEKEHTVSGESKNSSRPEFFATGVSIVMHPQSPMVPIIHMNIRYFEMDGNIRWLGGGIDLTPHYINKEDAKFFHAFLKKTCDKHNSDYYTKFKTWADDYFFITHRNETRGVGGIFFDRLNETENMSWQKNSAFWQDVGKTFAPVYVSLIERNRGKEFTVREKQWQQLRRGRYV